MFPNMALPDNQAILFQVELSASILGHLSDKNPIVQDGQNLFYPLDRHSAVDIRHFFVCSDKKFVCDVCR